MVDIDVRYEGELRCKAQHGPSRDTLSTDAPVDNNGRGEAFSPTDLLATALGTCVLTVMGIAARGRGFDLGDTTTHVVKEMSADLPRRVSKVTVRVVLPLPADHEHRKALEAAAKICPVSQSLRADLEVDLSFEYGGQAPDSD